jgi:hypothetical protein
MELSGGYNVVSGRKTFQEDYHGSWRFTLAARDTDPDHSSDLAVWRLALNGRAYAVRRS